jgi:hypothetical protein
MKTRCSQETKQLQYSKELRDERRQETERVAVEAILKRRGGR